MKREKFVNYLDDLLGVKRFSDYCPNGLQVEGRREIRHVVAGVTASQALIDEAILRGADTLLVHHGWFWRGENPRVTGWRKSRLQTLLKHDINLIAYHLPLDAHPELGNNAGLSTMLNCSIDGHFGDQNIGCFGEFLNAKTLSALGEKLTDTLKRAPLIIGNPNAEIRRIAWCSGGAQDYFEAAINQGVDAFLSGEISEPQVHMARESGVAYIAAGHHATERFGIAALAEFISDQLALACEFVEIDNPV